MIPLLDEALEKRCTLPLEALSVDLLDCTEMELSRQIDDLDGAAGQERLDAARVRLIKKP